MGFDINAVRFLVAARANGVAFDDTLMIGRQGLFIEADALSELLHAAGNATADAARVLREEQGFAEPLLKALGARRVSSIDYSSYQGATIVHDMNIPVPESLKQQFSLVIDGGSLEHIFNFPQAVKNCMEMVACGGDFITLTVMNNFVGHGFYQFSPELFFRVFCPANGFKVTRMIAYEEDWSDLKYYDVADPADVGGRVTLVNRYPTLLMMLARRIAVTEIFATTPQQSDYVSTWSAFGPSERSAAAGAIARQRSGASAAIAPLVARAGALAPAWLRRQYRAVRHGPVAFSRRFFAETQLL